MSTVFVTLCDNSDYYRRARLTIDELRDAGGWTGDIVLMTIDFDPQPIPGVEIHRVSHLCLDKLLEAYKTNPLKHCPDDRWRTKLYQWDKLQVFTDFFRRWERVTFLDAGMRIIASVQPLLDLEWRGLLLGPDDTDHPASGSKKFRCQIETVSNPVAYQALVAEFGEGILDVTSYLLNCMFVFDTALLDRIPFQELIDTMNTYPIAACNEMTIMNLVFHFRHHVWKAFPTKAGTRYLFGWNETNYIHHPVRWVDFHFMKYPFYTPPRLYAHSNKLQSRYLELCHRVTDIHEHLSTLASYASLCKHITECGVRGAISSYALATGIVETPNAKLVQVDPEPSLPSENFRLECERQGLPVVYYQGSDLDCPMEDTDLLFIDTWHVYGQLKRELARWHSSVRKFIILHDVEVDKWKGETLRCGGDVASLSRQFGIPETEITRGLWPAVLEFLAEHPEWTLQYHATNCNGLAVLSRVPTRE
jgi:hypothetical protein